MSKPIQMERGVKYRDADKMALIPVKNVVTERQELLRKPEWLKSSFRLIPAAFRVSKLQCVRMVCIRFVKRPPALTCLSALTTVRQHL